MTNLIIVIFCVQRKCRCAALHKVCGLWLLSFEKSTKKQKLILWQRNETQTLLIIIENHYHWPFPKVPPTKFPGEPYLDWGSKIGDEEDKKKLREIITKELKKPENRGNLEFFPQYSDHYTSSSGMDEDLAEAIDEEFYNSYKMWKDDNRHETVNQRVGDHWWPPKNYQLNTVQWFQIRDWLGKLESHLGDRATPRTIVDVIRDKKLSQANKLSDSIKAAYDLDH